VHRNLAEVELLSADALGVLGDRRLRHGGVGACTEVAVRSAPRKHQRLINVIAYTIGEYWLLAETMRARSTPSIRKFKWTVRQIIQKFVDDPNDANDPHVGPTSRPSTICASGERRAPGKTWIDVIHVIEPNEDYIPGRVWGLRGMQTRSVYYELGGDPDTLLGGPWAIPIDPVKSRARWETNSDKRLRPLARDVLLRRCQTIDGAAESARCRASTSRWIPPLIGDAALKRTTVSQLPGDVTWLETSSREPRLDSSPCTRFKPDLGMDDRGPQGGRASRIKAGMYSGRVPDDALPWAIS